jgi:putative transposase
VLRAFERRPELQKFVTAKWLETQNYSCIAELVERAWGGPLLPYKKDSRAPGYAAIQAFVESIPPSVRDCATLPKQKWEAKHAPYIVTGRGQLTEPNQVWVADHRLYDVLMMNDCFSYAPPHAAFRLWETCIQDMRTRVIVGSVWNVTPSWRTIASALRQGISRFGKPALFYCDNGKDFRKVGDGAERGTLLQLDDEGRVPCPSETQGLLARLGIKVSYCTPRHPQAKQIESYFSFVSKRFDRLFFKRGYTGSRPDMRSDLCSEAEKQHKEFLAGKRRESPLMGAAQFIRVHAQWLKEYNETHCHGGRGMDGRTPVEVMNELLPVSQRQIPDMLALAPFFWDVQKRKVSNCKIQINNFTYSAALDDAEAIGNMYLANETTVAVHCDPNDLAQALAYEDAPNGKLLGRLVSDELAAQGPITADHVQAMTRTRKKLWKASKQALAAQIYGVPSEIDLLSERATGTDDARPVRNFSRALPPARSRVAEVFVSDSVAKSRGVFDDLIVKSKEKE